MYIYIYIVYVYMYIYKVYIYIIYIYYIYYTYTPVFTRAGEAPQHIILGDAWNAAAPTGASWRNWPRGPLGLRPTGSLGFLNSLGKTDGSTCRDGVM